MVDQRAVAGAVNTEPFDERGRACTLANACLAGRLLRQCEMTARGMHDPVDRAERLAAQQRRNQPDQQPACGRACWLDRLGSAHRDILPQHFAALLIGQAARRIDRLRGYNA